MSVDLSKIRNDIREAIENLKNRKKMLNNNETIINYINGEIAGLGIALHQIETEIFEVETDVFTKDN